MDLAKVDRDFEIKASELKAAITLYKSLAPEYLAGRDARFDRGDIEWIASKFDWPASSFVRNRLSVNEDLLEPEEGFQDTACAEPEDFSVVDLQAVETATETMGRFFKRLGIYQDNQENDESSCEALAPNDNGLMIKRVNIKK